MSNIYSLDEARRLKKEKDRKKKKPTWMKIREALDKWGSHKKP